MRELHRASRLAFVPSTNKEKGTLTHILRGRTAVVIDPSLGKKHIDSVRSSTYKRANKNGTPKEAAHEAADKSERSILNEWVDYLENARTAYSSLVLLQNTLRQHEYGENPLKEMLAEVFAGDDETLQKRVVQGVLTLLQYRDILRLTDDAIEPPFEPLRTTEVTELARDGARKRIVDPYTAALERRDDKDEMLDYIIAQAIDIRLVDIGPLLENALKNQKLRGTFWHLQLKECLKQDDPLLDVISKTKKVQ